MPLHRILPRASLAMVAVFSLAACAKKEAGVSDSAATVAPPADTAKPAAAAQPNDAQIAQIVLTANSLDSAAAVMAKTKGTSKAVKDFAQTMITDHSSVNKQAVALATKLNLTPENNDVSRQLESGAEQSQATLRGLSGAAFDSAYIGHEVEYHQAVLDALDKTLIPDAQNAELKALLEKARPAFEAHLKRAKDLQASLAKK